jgi:hypothetical protein
VKAVLNLYYVEVLDVLGGIQLHKMCFPYIFFGD